jgi:hypothetical protein
MRRSHTTRLVERDWLRVLLTSSVKARRLTHSWDPWTTSTIDKRIWDHESPHSHYTIIPQPPAADERAQCKCRLRRRRRGSAPDVGSLLKRSGAVTERTRSNRGCLLAARREIGEPYFSATWRAGQLLRAEEATNETQGPHHVGALALAIGTTSALASQRSDVLHVPKERLPPIGLAGSF